MINNALLGYGSFFPKTPVSNFKEEVAPTFLGTYRFFYAGRPAMKYALNLVAEQRHIRYIWLPSYYCPFVKAWIEHEFTNIKYYDLDPFHANVQPNWSLFDATDDVVILNNYWGMKQITIPNGERPVIIEDHSHGWLSEACKNSKADLCFASLRKTLPLPLGGIFWKSVASQWNGPVLQENLMVKNNPTPMNTAWDLMDTAMSLKAAALSEAESDTFMEIYAKGEVTVRDNYDLQVVTSEHLKVMKQWFLKDLGFFKRKNLNYILHKIQESDTFKIYAEKQGTPFGLLLCFKDPDTLARFKQYLITRKIFPAELWPRNNIAYAYKHLLNVHIDFRYAEADLDYMAQVLNEWKTT